MSHARSRLLRSLALVAIGGMLLAGCGSDEEEGGGGEGGSDEPTKTVKIGLIAPLSGSLSALGLGMKNSADLAIKQANEEGEIEGWKIVFQPEDDTAKADVGAQVATKLSSDNEVAAVIGTLNSSVALQVQPILARENIAMISPANTGIALTMGDKPEKARPYENYFRVCTNDAIQGPFAADYAYNKLGARTAVLIHDKKAYGQGLTQEFQKRFTSLGGKVAGVETINPGDQDFSAVVSKIRPLNPQVVYYGGEYPEAAPLSAQLKAGGVKVPLMGGDGIFDPTFIQNAGASSNGDLATSVGAPPEKLASAKQFIDDYKGANYAENFSAYGPQAYDAAKVIIAALAKVLPGKDAIDDEVRQEIIEAIQDTDLEGVTGDVAFDEFGDTKTRLLTVYRVENGAWKDVETGEFE